ncbi:MAG TPA: AsmA family protein [Steroidobacteraceae bacterium]|nr:AsmA family protein [Steroidobacteraceae bacterium]
MRVLKILGILIGALVVVAAAVLLAVYLFFDPNAHKDRITAAVKQATGRELSLPGRLRLAVFPWIAIETGAASLGNPPGFGNEPFLTLRRAKLSVKLLPLLHKQLQIGRVEIDGLDLRLKQDARGKGNWEDWGSKAPAQASTAGGGMPALDLAGVAITDSRIAFQDMVADHLAVTIGHLAPGVAFPISLHADLITAPGAQPLPLQLEGRLALDLDHRRYQFSDLKLKGSVQPAGAPQPLVWSFTTPAADLDLAAQRLAKTSFTAAAGEAKLTGQISGEKLLDAPALAGSFVLAPLAPRALFKQLGIAPPVTRDGAVLARFAAQGTYAWQGTVARLGDLQLALDDSKLTGRFAYDTHDGGMDFALGLDQINLDRYQPPPSASPAKAAAPSAAQPIELPVDLLKPLRAHGSFNVGAIQVGGAHLTKLSAGIDIADAVARFAPLRAELYGGHYSGDIGIDMRPAQPRLTMDEHMSGIDIAKLMKDFANSGLLSGQGNLDVKLAASGRDSDALIRTLTGSAGLNLQNGAVEGFDVWYAIGQAQSLIKNRTLSGAPDSKRTSFDTFKANAALVNGVATCNDLTIASQLLRITGAGIVNLVSQELDYNVTAAVLKSPPGADADIAALQAAAIPVKITGTLTDPKIRPDLGGLAKAQVKKLVDEHKDEVKDKAKQKAQSVLKGLLGGKKSKDAGGQ